MLYDYIITLVMFAYYKKHIRFKTYDPEYIEQTFPFLNCVAIYTALNEVAILAGE